MQKTKIKQRIENAIDAFFDDEISTNNNSLTFSGESGLLKEQLSEAFTEKADVFVKILKQVFLFLPGTFVLFSLSLIAVFLVLNPSLGTTLLHSERLVLVMIISAFMTTFGLGSLKNRRHLIIPASILLVGSAVGAVVALSGGGVNFIDTYAMYFLPLALITPVLAKSWIDSKCKDFD